MKKVTKKITTEEYNDGKLVKRVVEEVFEEQTESKSSSPAEYIKPFPQVVPWSKTTPADNIAYLGIKQL